MTDVWVNTGGAMALLGITGSGMLFLQRAGYIPPDCRLCGRVRWKSKDLVSQRDELRAWLLDHYPEQVNELPVSENTDTVVGSSG